LEKVAKPVSVAVGDQDVVMSLAQVDVMKKIWADDLKDVATEVVVYPGAGHGFCVRVDPKNKNLLQQSLDAEQQAIKWFTKYLVQ
jgi:dienelactone hydrolase